MPSPCRLLCTPSGGAAVRGGRFQRLKAKDLEYLGPAHIALDRKADLGLTATQTVQLDSAAKAYVLEAKDFGRAIDTLQNVMLDASRNLMGNPVANGMNLRRNRPETPKDSISQARKDSIDQLKADKDQERYMAAKNALTSTLLKIREWYDAKVVGINALLTEPQRTKIDPMFDSASTELTDRLHWTNAGT